MARKNEGAVQENDSMGLTDEDLLTGVEAEQNPEAEQSPVAEAEQNSVEKSEKVSLRAVFGGPMVNPITEDKFTSEPSKPVVIDDWLATQIEAGKIAIAE